MTKSRIALYATAFAAIGAIWFALEPPADDIAMAPARAPVEHPAPVPAEPAASGADASINPISVDGIDRFAAILARPLFRPDRRPKAPDPPPVEEPPPAVVAETFSADDFTLLGIVATGPERVALLRWNQSQELVRLKAGQSFGGWTVRAVWNRDIVIERGGQEFSLTMFAPPRAETGTDP